MRNIITILLFFLTIIIEVTAKCPNNYQVSFETDVKSSSDPTFLISVNKSLAPLGAERFYELVNDGFYDNSAFFRVVPKFVVQFGISGNKTENDKWLHKVIKDDPVIGSNTEGTITFATAGPNTRTSQVFINYKDNSRLDNMGFAPFGIVVSGFSVAMKIFNPTPNSSNGVSQDLYEKNGNEWIKKNYPGINFITKATSMQKD